MPKKKTKETQAEQSEAFKAKAREIGADTDKADDEVMRRLAQQTRDKDTSRGRRRRG
jgi:hypothetical protein